MAASCSTDFSPTSPTPPLKIPPKGILKNPTVLQQWLSIIQLIFSSYMSHKPDPKKMVIHYIAQRNAEDAELIMKAIPCDIHDEEGMNLKLGRTLKKEYLGVKTMPREIIIKEGKTPYIWLEAFLNKADTSNRCILSFSEQIEYRKKILYLMSDLDIMLLNNGIRTEESEQHPLNDFAEDVCSRLSRTCQSNVKDDYLLLNSICMIFRTAKVCEQFLIKYLKSISDFTAIEIPLKTPPKAIEIKLIKIIEQHDSTPKRPLQKPEHSRVTQLRTGHETKKAVRKTAIRQTSVFSKSPSLKVVLEPLRDQLEIFFPIKLEILLNLFERLLNDQGILSKRKVKLIEKAKQSPSPLTTEHFARMMTKTLGLPELEAITDEMVPHSYMPKDYFRTLKIIRIYELEYNLTLDFDFIKKFFDIKNPPIT